MEGALEGSNNEAGGPACPQPECMAAPVTPPTPSPLLENARSDMREDSPQSSQEPTQLAERRTSKIGYIGAAFTSIGSVGTVYVNQTLRKAQTYAESTRTEIRKAAVRATTPTSPGRPRNRFPTPGVPHTTYAELTTQHPSMISHILYPTHPIPVHSSSHHDDSPLPVPAERTEIPVASTLPPISSTLRGMLSKAAVSVEGASRVVLATTKNNVAPGVPGRGRFQGSTKVTRTPEEEAALLASIPDLVAVLAGFDASPEQKGRAAVGLRKTLQSADRVFHAAREATVDADAVPVLLQLVYSATDVAEVCWILQLLGATVNPVDRCKDAILDEHGVVMLIDVCDRTINSPQARAHCLAALYNLAIGREDLKMVYAESTELLAAVLADIRHAEAEGPQSGLRLLRLIVTDAPDDRHATVAEFGMLDAVIDKLKENGPISSAQIAAIPCLLSLVKGSPERACQVADADARSGNHIIGKLVELRKRLQSKTTPSLLERGFVSVYSLASGSTGSHFKTDPKPLSLTADRALKDTEEVIALIRLGRRGDPPVLDESASSLETPMTSSEGVSSGNGVAFTGAVWGAFGNAPATFASAKRKLALLGSTAKELALTATSRKHVEEENAANIGPILDPDDPNEIMMRRVTEKTLRSEFQKAGGRVTPAQIAERFKQSLNDDEYGPENRVRFREVIDRIAIPELVEEDGKSFYYLQLRDVASSPSRPGRTEPIQPLGDDAERQ